MFATFSRSWELAKQSLAVLRHEKQLVIFPILSTAALLLVLASFAVPALLAFDWGAAAEQGGREGASADPAYGEIGVYVGLFAFYFLNYFVITFFNSALISCTINRFNGDDTGVGEGLRAATKRMPQILAWAAFAATVGVVLRIIAEKVGVIGRMIMSFLGMAWSVATYFVVPVLVVEGVGPFAAVKRSVGVLRKSWGEALVSNIGLSVFTFALTLAASLPLLAGLLIGFFAESWIPAAVGGGVTAVLWIAVALISSTLNVILVAALYRYATTGLIPEHFDGDTLRQVFKTKND